MHFSILAVCGLITGALASPTTQKRHVVHERRDRLPAQWSKSGVYHGDVVIPMRIALTQANLHKGDEFLMDVSHPDSENYGKHWSAKEVAEMFAPSEETVSSVYKCTLLDSQFFSGFTSTFFTRSDPSQPPT